jgi:hypothetical protein
MDHNDYSRSTPAHKAVKPPDRNFCFGPTEPEGASQSRHERKQMLPLSVVCHVVRKLSPDPGSQTSIGTKPTAVTASAPRRRSSTSSDLSELVGI